MHIPDARDTRVRLIGNPSFVGTLIRYYAPLPSGKRNAEVRWDDASIVLTPLETQIETLPSSIHAPT